MSAEPAAGGLRIEDHRVEGPAGSLFARSWHPGEEAGAPFLLLHDSLGSVDLWRDFPGRLARATGHRVVAYDRLGFGRSDPYPGRIAPDFIAAEAATIGHVADRLGLERLILFGHSVGGGMAVCAAARRPELCAAVVTESAQAFIEERTLAGIREAREAFAEPGQIERLARYHGGKARWVLDAWIDTWLDPGRSGWSLDDELARVACPILALHGADDEFGTRAQPERIGRLAAGPSEVVILDGCGHVPHRERPEAVLAPVARLLARI